MDELYKFWLILVLGGISLIFIGMYLSTVLESVLDRMQPERLKRFDLQQYKRGVKDSTPSNSEE